MARLGLVAILCTLAGFFSDAMAQLSDSPFAGTKWTSVAHYGKAISTIEFQADGTWNEVWKKKHEAGKWSANADNTEVTVIRDDQVVLHYVMNSKKQLVRDLGSVVYQQDGGAATPDTTSTSPEDSTTPVPGHTVPTVKLTEDQARAIVLVKGDTSVGTGFLIKTSDGPVVVTNIHVIANNPNLKITTNNGTPITIVSYKGATDRDLVEISIKGDNLSFLDVAPDISAVVQPGDEVITPGNSEGGDVVLNTAGKVLGIGPDRVEFNNPVYLGNSGGPVFHTKSGKVIGVVTEAIKVDLSDELDKKSFANRNSAIGQSIRYFGLRLDTVTNWEPYDWNRLQTETAFLDQFNLRSRCLDCFLNAPNDTKPEDLLWEKDDKIVKANNNCTDLAAGADISQRLDAVRSLYSELSDVANIDMDAIQNTQNFYSFSQQRAKDELAYRKALKAELDQISNDVSRMSSLPRTNN